MDGYAAFVSEDFLCTQGSKAITRAMEAAGMRLIERPLPPHVDFVVSPGASDASRPPRAESPAELLHWMQLLSSAIEAWSS